MVMARRIQAQVLALLIGARLALRDDFDFDRCLLNRSCN